LWYLYSSYSNNVMMGTGNSPMCMTALNSKLPFDVRGFIRISYRLPV